MKRPPVLALALAALPFLAPRGCGPGATPPPAEPATPERPPWFEDITDRVGLNFVHQIARDPTTLFMPHAIGSGAALFDCDGDGLLDIYLLQNGGPDGEPNRLFRQRPDGTFADAGPESGLQVRGYGMGAAVGDVNNDGRPDLLVSEYGGLHLFLNQGNGRFVEVTASSGLKNPAWGTSAAFLDYDGDGWLDLVVANYVDYDPTLSCTAPNGTPDYCAPRTFAGRAARLFRNRGPDGQGGVRFEDVSLPSGVGKKAGPGLGVLVHDFDGDGRPDIFVANDGAANHLWMNQGDGTFKEEAVPRNVAYNGMGKADAGMGVALGDVNGDGLFDLFVTHLTEETHTLWVQGPKRGTFTDRTVKLGVTGSRWRGTGFGTCLADFDQNGFPDIAIANGRVSRGPAAHDALGPHWTHYAERNQLLVNEGGRFVDLSPFNPALCGTPNVARGLAVGDIDNDGALDLLVTTVTGPARLYRNVAHDRGHWLTVRALDPALSRDAYGAEVTILADGRRRGQVINPASSFLCSNDVRAHFGLGKASSVEAIEVKWPGGPTEIFPGGPADRHLVLRKGEGKKGP
jgi:hypothetical protein